MSVSAQIVRAKPVDAPVLTALAQAAKAQWGYPANWLAEWSEGLTITPGFIAEHPTYLALEAGVVVGFYAVVFADGTASLEHLWVAPERMRRGIGRLLFQHARACAREAGAAGLRIVSDPNAAAFYRRCGARDVGQEPAPVAGSPRLLPVLEVTL